MSEETLKYHSMNLHLKLDSYSHETAMYEELIHFRRIVSWESLVSVVQKFIC